jgi:hypothetical protein
VTTFTSTMSATERSASDWRSTTARVGLAGRALLYFVFGLFAVDVALDSGGGAETTTGALERVAGSAPGRLMLIALCVGLVALVTWKALQSAAGDPVEGSEATDRAEYAIRAVGYGAVLVAAVSVLVANWDSPSGRASGGNSEQQATATVLEWPGGQFLAIAAGLGIVVFALSQLWVDAWRGEFMQRIATSPLSAAAEHGVDVAGRLGYVAKGVTTAIVGVFLVIVGWQHDPSDTTGLSGAISELGESGWGGAVLWVVAIGMFGFALVSLAEAKLRRAT